jgi:sugar phosphate isomerase/epimerase
MNALGADKTGLEQLEAYTKAGCDYIELPLFQIMALRAGEREALIKTARSSGLLCRACNCFFPGSIKVAGPDVSEAAVREYARSAIDVAAALGASRIVFGSGAARNIPGDFSPAEAEKQYCAALASSADLAAPYNITLVIEPLNRMESNIINTVSDGLRLARSLNHPGVRCLADYFHFTLGNEDTAVLRTAGGWITHAHIANTLERRLPAHPEESGYAEFIGALRQGGYTGDISIEGYAQNIEADFTRAVALLRGLAVL